MNRDSLMKSLRSMAALLVLSLPLTAEAKVLVVNPTMVAQPDYGDFQANCQRNTRLVTRLLEIGGSDYVVVGGSSIKTEFCRTGKMVWNYGTAGAYAEQFDAVIHMNWLTGTKYYALVGEQAKDYRPDSMLKFHQAGEAIGTGTTKAPTVPQLIFGTNASGLAGNTLILFGDGVGNVTRCTTGVTAQVGGADVVYYAGDPTTRGLASTYIMGNSPNSTPPAGGFRSIIKSSNASLSARTSDTDEDDVCRWCDSMATVQAVETLQVWERPMRHVTGAAPVIFAMMGGIGSAPDSLASASAVAYYPLCEGEISIALMALAHLDSITGGKVFSKNKVPFKAALTIDGAYSYNSRMHNRGILKADSATFAASMDSLATLRIPVTFGVNLDSVAINAEWKRWLEKITRARFSPQNWTGIADTTASSGAASFTHPVDIMGRYRRRIAFGDSSAAGKDTSLWALLRGGRFKCDSIWPGKASRFLMAPDDDWSPLGMNGRGVAPGIDSVIFAIGRAGFNGIRINAGDPDYNAQYLPADPKGWYNRQGWGLGVRGSQVKLLAYPGSSRAGAVAHFAHRDSAAPWDTARFGMIYQDMNRAWVGITQAQDFNYDTWPYDNGSNNTPRIWDGVWLNQKDRVYPQKYRGSIICMNANDFSGDPARPTRRGWWVIKSLANQFTIINRLAGRTLIEFAYPEDVDP